jgi:Ca-activated chloride channel family protein
MPAPRRTRVSLFACAALAAAALAAPRASDTLHPGAHAQSGAPRADAAPVRTLTVTVTDERGHFVKGLGPADFEVFDGKRRLEVVSLSDADGPASDGILFDASASMRDSPWRSRGPRWFAELRAALSIFLEGGHPSNEYFLVAFNHRPQLLLEATTSARDVLAALDRLGETRPKGHTALYDACYLALDRLAGARHPKRAVVVISDGGDNASRYTRGDLKQALRETDVMVYAVTPVDAELDGFGLALDALRAVEEMTVLSGGRALYPAREGGMSAAMQAIAFELRNQYAVGIVPVAGAGGWHEIKVRLAELRDKKGKGVKLRPRARRGFYDPPRGR